MSITGTEEVGTVMIAIVLRQIRCSKAIQISLQWTDVIIQQHPAALKEGKIRPVIQSRPDCILNTTVWHCINIWDGNLQFSILGCIVQRGPTPVVF